MVRVAYRIGLVSLLALIALGLGLTQPAAPAQGIGACPSPFTTAGEHTCVVPAGATNVTITVIGGAGAGGYGSGGRTSGGKGDLVQAKFAVASSGLVTPGETLYVEVGGNGGSPERVSTGGANGGGLSGGYSNNGAAGGGGGASDVRTCSIDVCTTLTAASDTRLLVAGGGGGGGGGGDQGGNGGNARQAGSSSSGQNAAGGGEAGNAFAGGAGGIGSASSGGSGSLGAGGTGGPTIYGGSGGGGGGGYYGGGGGGGGHLAAGGGGGGGSDFIKPGATLIAQASSSAQPSVTISFVPVATVTTLTSNNNPSNAGEPVTLTATVTCTGYVPTGNLFFYEYSQPLYGVTLNATGTVSFTTSSLSPGRHSITATYQGDSNCQYSSAALDQTVNALQSQAPSGVLLSSSDNPSPLGQPVTFTAVTSCHPGAASAGTMTFTDGSTTLGSVPVDSAGQASLQVRTLTAGDHTITASFDGGGPCAAAVSAPLTQTVRSTGFGFGH